MTFGASRSASLTNGPVVGATGDKVVASDQGTVVNDQVADGDGAPDTGNLGGGGNTLTECTSRGFITSSASGVELSVDRRGGEALTVGNVQHGTELGDEAALSSGLEGLVGHTGHGIHVQGVTEVAVDVTAFGGHVTGTTSLRHTVGERHGRAPVLLGSTSRSNAPGLISTTSGNVQRLVTSLAGDGARSTEGGISTGRSGEFSSNQSRAEVGDQLALRGGIPVTI